VVAGFRFSRNELRSEHARFERDWTKISEKIVAELS
jgi:hypothetical protein